MSSWWPRWYNFLPRNRPRIYVLFVFWKLMCRDNTHSYANLRFIYNLDNFRQLFTPKRFLIPRLHFQLFSLNQYFMRATFRVFAEHNTWILHNFNVKSFLFGQYGLIWHYNISLSFIAIAWIFGGIYQPTETGKTKSLAGWIDVFAYTSAMNQHRTSRAVSTLMLN